MSLGEEKYAIWKPIRIVTDITQLRKSSVSDGERECLSFTSHFSRRASLPLFFLPSFLESSSKLWRREGTSATDGRRTHHMPHTQSLAYFVKSFCSDCDAKSANERLNLDVL